MHIEEPRNHRAVVMCRHCGTVRELDYTTRGGIPRCPVCKGRRRDVAQLARDLTAESRERRRKRRLMARLVTLLAPRVCPQCGAVFHSRRRGVMFCSKECARKSNHDGHMARAHRFGSERETGVTLVKLVRRDGLTCYICGKTCDWEDTTWGGSGPNHPTIDHVVPVSKGGGHVWSNVRVACGACNAMKNDKMPDEMGIPVRESCDHPVLPRARLARANSRK